MSEVEDFNRATRKRSAQVVVQSRNLLAVVNYGRSTSRTD